MNKFMIKTLSAFVPNKKKRIELRRKLFKREKEKFENVVLDRLKGIEFRQTLIMNHFMTLSDARPATGELRNIQTELEKLLSVFDQITRAHNIDYWVDCGTLLGAVRHGGFVPWDDDLDVGIRESELPALIKAMNAELPHNLKFIQRGEEWYVVIDESTGAYLDVFIYMTYGNDDGGDQKLRLRDTKPYPDMSMKMWRPFPSSLVFPIQRLPFGEIEISAPRDTHNYLRLKFGNYLLFPKNYQGHLHVKEDLEFYPEDFQ